MNENVYLKENGMIEDSDGKIKGGLTLTITYKILHNIEKFKPKNVTRIGLFDEPFYICLSTLIRNVRILRKVGLIEKDSVSLTNKGKEALKYLDEVLKSISLLRNDRKESNAWLIRNNYSSCIMYKVLDFIYNDGYGISPDEIESSPKKEIDLRRYVTLRFITVRSKFSMTTLNALTKIFSKAGYAERFKLKNGFKDYRMVNKGKTVIAKNGKKKLYFIRTISDGSYKYYITKKGIEFMNLLKLLCYKGE